MKKRKIYTKYYLKYNILEKTIEKRFKIMIGVIILMVLILFLGLFRIQVVSRKQYVYLLETATGKIVEGPTAPRGRIYDRNHNILVDNEPVKVIYYKKPTKITSKEEIKLATALAKHIEIDHSRLSDYDLRNFWVKSNSEAASLKIKEEEYQQLKERKLTKEELEKLKRERITSEELELVDKKIAYIYCLMNKGYSYEEKTIKNTDVTNEEFAIIGTNLETLQGFNVRLDWNRIYLYNDTFKSVFGSVSTRESGIPSDLKEDYLKKGYHLNDRVGTSYIEYQYDDYLRGEKNKYVINKNQLELVEEGSRGNDIVLTIDIHLQQAIEEILTQEILKTKNEPNTAYYNRSFVIVSHPKTGEILAMAGKQAVDRNGEYVIVDYTPGILTAPVVVGSIIKGASHIVGYNTGALTIGEVRYDNCVKLRGAPIKCSWKPLGRLDDLTALKQSSNTYQFYTALKVAGVQYFYDMPFKPDSIAFETYRNTFKEFGLGVKTEIDLPLESTGYKGNNQVGGLLLDFAIGQYDNYTPIQLNQYMSTIANNGVRVAPYLLKEVYSSKGQLEEKIFENTAKELNTVTTKEEFMARVKEGFKTVMEYGGTGSGYIDRKYQPAGKTGTSQSFVDSDLDGIIDKETITNTFSAYAPYDNPRVVFTVISPDIYYSETNSTYQSNVNRRISQKISEKYFELYP